MLSVGGGLHNPRQPIQDIRGTLHVVAVISNPCRYESRYNLYRTFKRHMEASGVHLVTVELAYGDRPYEVIEPGEPDTIALRTTSELWHKENLINLGIASLPQDWKYVAWVDADILFARPDWCQEVIQQLQHYPVVQLWSHAQDLGPAYEPLDQHVGFCYSHRNHPELPSGDLSKKQMSFSTAIPAYAYEEPKMMTVSVAPPKKKTYFYHPGYGWAARREVIDATGGLIDWGILGAGDHHMAKALVGKVHEAVAVGMSVRYIDLLMEWQDSLQSVTRGDFGYVPGTINHFFHGPKVARQYWTRWGILVRNQFNPDTDIRKDSQGVWNLVVRNSRQQKLRDDIRAYFRARNEDSIDV